MDIDGDQTISKEEYNILSGYISEMFDRAGIKLSMRKNV